MKKLRSEQSIPSELMSRGQLSRREVVLCLLAGAAAGAVWPLASTSHPLNSEIFENTLAALHASDWSPLVLSAGQYETLMAVSERIIPGSKVAGVGRFIDLLLSVDTVEHQKKFKNSLAAMNVNAQKQFGHSFFSLKIEQQDTLLTGAAAEPPGDKKTEETLTANESEEPIPSELRLLTLHDHFQELKNWISEAYYSSEPGMRELGWTGDLVFESFPGCQHAEDHG